jgi:glycogen operon protein
MPQASNAQGRGLGAPVASTSDRAIPEALPATKIGQSAPLGATVCNGGVNFSIFSRKASSVELLFFDHEDDARPAWAVNVNPETNRTYHYWHVFVPGARPGQVYAYRIRGPFDPANGFRFNPDKVLLDPYGRGVVVPKNTIATPLANLATIAQWR